MMKCMYDMSTQQDGGVWFPAELVRNVVNHTEYTPA
jgi:hypothetical protein